MQWLEGEHIEINNTAAARKLIGKSITYLRSRDIDKSGRGYFFPQTGTIQEVYARNICINGNWCHLGDLREIVLNNI